MPTLDPLATMLALVAALALILAVEEGVLPQVIAAVRHAVWRARFGFAGVMWWAGVEVEIWRLWAWDISRWWRRRPRWGLVRDSVLEVYERRYVELSEERERLEGQNG